MNKPLYQKMIVLVLCFLTFLLISGCSQTEMPAAEQAGTEMEESIVMKAAAYTETPIPAPTFTPTPAFSPTPTPEADPRVILGKPVWGAVFEDGTQTWFPYDHSNGSAEVRDNMLVLKSKKTNGYDNWSMSYPKMTDFYLELQFTTGPECAGKDRYGILYRAPDSTQGYLYQVACDGSFQVRLWDGEEFTQIISWTVSEHIFPGPDMEHRLGVWAESDEYKFYVNGFQVGEYSDATFVDEGTFGAAHGATNTPGFTIYVSEARVWELPDN